MSASTEKKNRVASREAGTDKKSIAIKAEEAKKAKEKTKWTIIGVATVIVIAAILILNYVCPKYCAAVKIGDAEYTAAEVNYNYANQYYNFANQYGQYASMFGLDTQYGVSGLRSQDCSMTDGGTWRDYFIDTAISAMTQYKALGDYAAENGIVLTDEEKAEIDEQYASLGEIAEQNGFTSTEKFIAAYYGSGVTEEIAKDQAYSLDLASKASQTYQDSLVYTANELDEKYASYNGDKDYFDVCSYYVTAELVEDEEGNSAATEETIAAAKKTAEDILAAYNSEELAAETDVEVRLNEAIARAGVESECTHSERALGSSISAYKDWALTASEGDATVAENSSGDGFYVAAFISHDDNNYKLAKVRHILIKAEADEDGNYTDEAKAAAKEEAERILDEWKSGEATEESFAALAEQYSEDTGSNTNGGLYDTVQKGQMVDEFDAFCFGGHKSGDTAIVYGESGSYAGYHVMYYVGEGELCNEYLAENDLVNEAMDTWMEDLTGNYTSEKTFWARYVG